MSEKKISFSSKANEEIVEMRNAVMAMFEISKDAFENLNKEKLIKRSKEQNSLEK